MIRQSLKFAWRGLRKTSLLHGLNALGLTLGLSVFYLVSLYIYQEKSFERDFSQKDRIFQISHTMLDLNLAMGSRNLPYVLHEIPEVSEFTSFKKATNTKVSFNEVEFMANMLTVDSSFFKVFDFDLLYGDLATVLDESRSAVISEEKAMEVFGTTDVMGRLMNVQRGRSDSLYQVSVIIKGVSQMPKFKTQLEFDLLVSEHRAVNGELNLDGWQNSSVYNYVIAAPGINSEVLDQRLFDLSYKYVYPKTVLGVERTEEEWRAEALYCGFYAESLSSLRIDSETSFNLMPPMNTGQLDTLFIIALAALIISVFNFINISTARASQRMKEVGVKRILGSSRGLLVFQFLLESFILIVLSSIVSLAIVEGIVQLKLTSIGLELNYSVLHSQEWILGLIAFVLSLTLLAGIYPAIYLSSGKLVSILKKGLPTKGFSVLNAGALRRFGIVFQFMCSVGLIATVITMFLQVDHMKTRDIGYESESVLVIDNTHHLKMSKNTFRDELLKLSSVDEAAYSNRLPSAVTLQTGVPVPITDSTEVSFSMFEVDPGFFDVMSMKFVSGVAFEDRPNSDIPEGGDKRYIPVVVNEVAARLLGHENAVGEIFLGRGEIVGVVNDFVFSDLRQEVGPVMITRKSSNSSYTYTHPLTVKTVGGLAALDEIKQVWSQFSEKELKYHLLESNYQNLVEAEENGFRAVFIFSVVAVIVSCLGLLGLAIFTIDQRLHEFGIRKVLGASVSDIIKLFGLGFGKLMLIAFLIALPISVFSMQNWLSNYADRIDLSVWIFLATGLVTILMVVSTLLFQSIKAGRLNPVDTLRSE